MEEISDGALLALIGFGGGLLLGLAARIGRFCTLGAVEDALYGGNSDRLRMWGVALGLSRTASSLSLLSKTPHAGEPPPDHPWLTGMAFAVDHCD